MTDPHQPRRYRFGSFEADAATGELRRQGLRIKVNVQPFQVLLLLLDRPGELLTREEIARQLWPDGTFVDYEHGVNSAVNRIREALGDKARTPRFIETLARRGYRFVAPVERIAPSPPENSVILSEVSRSASPRETQPKDDDALHIPTTARTFQPDAAAMTFQEPVILSEADRSLTAIREVEGPVLSLPKEPASRSVSASTSRLYLLATPDQLPRTPHRTVQLLFILLQLMYTGFYVGALANLNEIYDLLFAIPKSTEAFILLIVTAGLLIPVRAFLLCAVLFHAPGVRARLLRLWPFILPFDELWALSPFLLLHHINFGLALACTALLAYAPFAQRSLILMGAGQRQPEAVPA